ncbi:MAG: hypothetical protein B6I20_12700 [Bacteroidetes bacterium 4572_117]|nr:MAG: hypothetical protein B6I20_12700 [Bacteroidetes bacterium 4572_117]
MNEKILVIGATGMLGKSITEQLIKDKFNVSVFSTSKSRASKLFPNASIIEGNLKNAQSVREAMKGQDYVYMNLCIPTEAKITDRNPERDGVKTVVEIAKKEGVKRIAYLSPKIADLLR